MLDVDGTLIPYRYDALPSEKVKETIALAKQKVHVCLVTGRSYYSSKSILKALGLTEGYAVVDTGAFVIDIANNEIVYKQTKEMTDILHVIHVFEKNNVIFYLKDEKNIAKVS